MSNKDKATDGIKLCAGRGCKRAGVIRLSIALARKNALFCKKCADDLRKNGLVEEEIASDEYSCPRCPRSFQSESAREDHAKLVHGSLAMDFVCDRCCRPFVTMREARTHFRAAHPECAWMLEQSELP